MKRILQVSCFAFLVIISGQCKKDEPDASIPDAEIDTYFDLAYIASGGFEDLAKAKAISDGKPVRVLKDLVGTKDALWKGKEIPAPMWPTPPVYYNDAMGGYILVPNVSFSWWLSEKFTAIPQPYDVYIVMRDLQAVPYEGYISAGIGMRNKDDHLELKIDYNDATGFHSAVKEFANGSGVPVKNKMSIVRIQFNGANSKVFINNVQVGGTVDLGSAGTHELGYGTLSHAAQHDFYGMWMKLGGLLNDKDNEYVYGKLAEIYKPGSYPDKPIADKIRSIWSSTSKSWEAQYDYVSPDGTPEDKTKTEYKWGYHMINKTGGAPALIHDLDQTTFFIGSKATGKTLLRDDFPAIFTAKGNGSVEVFVSVKVFDTAGKSWDHIVRSQFTVDDIL